MMASARTSGLRRATDVLILGATIAFAILWLLPVVWVVAMSLKPNTELMRSTAGFLPVPFTLDNYIGLLKLDTVPRWLMHSLIVSVTMTILVLIVSSMAGYAFARLEFPFKKTLFMLVIAGLMVPEQAVFIPLHTMVSGWGLHNTHFALVMPRVAVPIGVFLMMQFFRSVPKELEEAAAIDHASRLTIFLKIMLPLSVPALTTLGLFTFIFAWNDFLWPLVSATKADMYTVTVGLASIQTNFAFSEGIGAVMASAVFASLPIVLLFLIFQRFIVAGVAMSAGK
ncbi:carbohydrate ABC transporter permease (plasmid) [Rhizobium leguminosarum bv. viciae 248]|uniref:carbohydrate ABC transporter permease n=1 Tax=Rhizobium leguminosarum TaxID=384 RepID=UPI00035CC67C|nr:carbohydrate ABC transporter permease [Rhizobium leguminosarum]MCA2410313.1 carbohydrate ABC transporter permease [Rhizobium leguminosarum]NKM61750.1 ABC transporter permease subunit [Rhizobium leguminosarum bv. viciae]QHW28792.1 carbohydrate ABC transporter permease [Rhizobium leguminosarum bv. viciae 248]